MLLFSFDVYLITAAPAEGIGETLFPMFSFREDGCRIGVGQCFVKCNFKGYLAIVPAMTQSGHRKESTPVLYQLCFIFNVPDSHFYHHTSAANRHIVLDDR